MTMRRRGKPEYAENLRRIDHPTSVVEARVMLSMRRTIDGLTAHSLACCFRLKDDTARGLLQVEQGRRGNASA